MLGLRGRRHAIGERHDVEALLVRAPHRRLDAAVGQEPTERDRLDALAPQDEVEVRAGERVETTLALDDDVVGLRRQVVDDVRSPRALDERLVVDDAGEDAVRVIGDLVVAVGEADRRVDHGGTRRPAPRRPPASRSPACASTPSRPRRLRGGRLRPT